MSQSESAPAARRRRRSAALAAVVVVAALAGILGYPSLVAMLRSTPSPSAAASAAEHRHDDRPGTQDTGAGPADGVVPDGVTVFDRYPAVMNLDPALLRALRQAATDADSDGIVFYVNSGWRSAKYQQQLFDQAISKYGSKAAAARWVATAETSAHVSGDAVDLGRSDVTSWLSEHGAGYGLCQIYGNEPWHYELRPDAADHGCPAAYADPTHDPRMKR